LAERHYGAGKTVCKPMLAAVANAVFDATRVRLRRVPFTAARMLAALNAEFRPSLRSNRQLQRGY
jgi:CO/xanthine dehydrogenase Mo-binding subunit